jgi:PEGA domain
MRAAVVGLIVVFSCLCAYAETVVSGDISKITFDTIGNPFIVDTGAEIPQGKTVVIPEGCVLLFKEFAGLTVKGSIAINGTEAHPVVLSSIHDTACQHGSSQPPNPFDWNGITIDKDAEHVDLRHFKLMYSVFGLKSQKENISVAAGLFKANGQFHFSINEHIQYVQDNVPYSYPPRKLDADLTIRSEPSGAAVYVDGKIFQASGTPATLTNLYPGRHAISVCKDGFDAFQEVVLEAGESREVTLALKKSHRTLCVSTTPPNAEVYVNKTPGRKTEPEATTPATLKNLEYVQPRITVFKKGFADTCFSVDLRPWNITHVNVGLRSADSKTATAQQSLVNDRWKVRVGRCALLASPILLAGGGVLLYLAQKDYKVANNADYFLSNTIVDSGDRYTAARKQYDDATRNGNTKTGGGFSLLGLGVLAGGVGIVLFF